MLRIIQVVQRAGPEVRNRRRRIAEIGVVTRHDVVDEIVPVAVVEVGADGTAEPALLVVEGQPEFLGQLPRRDNRRVHARQELALRIGDLETLGLVVGRRLLTAHVRGRRQQAGEAEVVGHRQVGQHKAIGIALRDAERPPLRQFACRLTAGHVEIRRSTHSQVLDPDRRRHRERVVDRNLQRRAHTRAFFGIDVMQDRGGLRRRERVGRRHAGIRRPDADLPVDEAAEVLVGGNDPQRDSVVDERHVVHRIEAAVAAAVLCRRTLATNGGLDLLQVRLVGHELDRAAHGTRTVERALRAAQYLDARQIEQIGVDAGVRPVATGRQDRRLVDIEARGRRVAARGGDAPDGIAAAPGSGRVQGHPGYPRGQGREVLDPRFRQRFRAVGDHRERHVLQVLAALLRGDDDVLERCRSHGVLGPGRRTAAGQHRDDEHTQETGFMSARCIHVVTILAAAG